MKIKFTVYSMLVVTFICNVNNASEKPNEKKQETIVAADVTQEEIEIICDFENLNRFHHWRDCRSKVEDLIQGLAGLDMKKPSLRNYRDEELIPTLVRELDFRSVQRPRGWGQRRLPEPSYNLVGNALIKFGQPVIQPILESVDFHPRSAIYIQQARRVLKAISKNDKAMEKLINDYAKKNPKTAQRILRLSLKHDLKPQLAKEKQYRDHLRYLVKSSTPDPWQRFYDGVKGNQTLPDKNYKKHLEVLEKLKQQIIAEQKAFEKNQKK